jgi:hypothetical protein
MMFTRFKRKELHLAPFSECYPLGDGIEVMSLHGAMQALA